MTRSRFPRRACAAGRSPIRQVETPGAARWATRCSNAWQISRAVVRPRGEDDAEGEPEDGSALNLPALPRPPEQSVGRAARRFARQQHLLQQIATPWRNRFGIGVQGG